jgi:hypothetical protein
MKTELRKVYFCDHCKKHNLSASSISRHEKYCRYNPNNRHKCFDMCVHLKKLSEIVRSGDSDYPVGIKTVFTCGVTGNKMYSYQLENKARLYPFIISFSGLQRMPLTCDLYKEMSFNEMEMRYERTEPND